MIVGVVNQKGGAGKTTLAVNLAGAVANRGASACIIDTDPQGSVLQWHAIAENPDITVMHNPTGLTRKAVRSLHRRFDHILIDSPPALAQITMEVLNAADMAIVPVAPSPLDIWSASETVDLIRSMKRRNRKLRPRLLVYRKVTGTRIGRQASEALNNYGFPVLKTEITHRIAYVEAMNAGLPVVDFAPRSKAAEEIKTLVKELF
jgi:chromosome partitioning protein